MHLRKKKSLLAIIVITFMVLIFVGRGLVRDTLLPIYVNLFYKPSISEHFDKEFSFVNRKVSTYGFTFNNKDTLQDECGVAGYEGVKETVVCTKLRASDDLHVTDSFAKQWRRTSPQLEQALLAQGWLKSTRDAKQPIAGIYANANGATIVYTKNFGQTECELRLGLTAFPYGSTTFPRDKEKTYIHESCTRNIEFFGGY